MKPKPSKRSRDPLPVVNIYDMRNQLLHKAGKGQRLLQTVRAHSEPTLFPPIDGTTSKAETSRSFSGPQPVVVNKGSELFVSKPKPQDRKLKAGGILTDGYRPLDKQCHPNASSSKKDQTVFRSWQHPNKQLSKSNPGRTKAPGQGTDREQDVTLSIRKKIEHFRQWHDEQYKKRLEFLKLQSRLQDDRQNEALVLNNLYKEYSKTLRTTNVPGLQIKQRPVAATADVSEMPSKRDGQNLPQLDGQQRRTLTVQMPPIAIGPGEDTVGGKGGDVAFRAAAVSPNQRAASPAASVPETLRDRVRTAKTWHTWRDANESYAYSDVRKYMEENSLIDPEKEKHIEDWVATVADCRQAGECVAEDGTELKALYGAGAADCQNDRDTSQVVS